MDPSWLHEQGPVDWQDFELASAAGKEILERLAGDRSLLRHLVFYAQEQDGFEDAGAWTGDGGELELFADASKNHFVYLHVGLEPHEGKAESQLHGYVSKVLSGTYRHVWYSDDGAAYVTDEQPPGLYAMRRGLTHSLSWDDRSTALVLREDRAISGLPEAARLTEEQYITVQHRADFAGVV